MNPSCEAQSGLSYASALGSRGLRRIIHCGPAGGVCRRSGEARFGIAVVFVHLELAGECVLLVDNFRHIAGENRTYAPRDCVIGNSII